MRVISRRRFVEFWSVHRRARTSLEQWYTLTRGADWKRFASVRQTFASADQVKVRSGRTVVVFNIGGGNYRLISAIHYNSSKVFVLRVLTHAEYTTDRWKSEL